MSRVLVADDNELNLLLVTDVLEMAGHDVLQAENGLLAVEQAIAKQPDLILLDLRMPVMDGEEAMRLLKKDGRTQHIPVVVLTASVMTNERERLLGRGFDGHIGKPFDVEKLTIEIDNYLNASA